MKEELIKNLKYGIYATVFCLIIKLIAFIVELLN